MILDASALLALLQNELGSDAVEAVIGQAKISAVNWSEVIQKLSRNDPDAASIRPDIEALGLQIVPFTVEQAEGVAALWPLTKPFGLSFADRACLQLGISTGLSVMTADKVWKEVVHAGLDVRVIPKCETVHNDQR